jgi:peptide deformylase
MIYDLVKKDNPVLHTAVPKWDFNNMPMDPSELSRNLAETMLTRDGIGLAANQCGLTYRVFVMKSAPIFACFNPMIVDDNSEKIYLEEGCLTYPKYFVKIERPKLVKVRFTQPDGEVITRVFDGITARVFQHELDHLNGEIFFKRATLHHRNIADRAFKKFSRAAK